MRDHAEEGGIRDPIVWYLPPGYPERTVDGVEVGATEERWEASLDGAEGLERGMGRSEKSLLHEHL